MANVSQFSAMKPISADSHISEPQNCYAQIEPKYRDRVPLGYDDPVKGATFKFDGMPPLGIGLATAAGIPSHELSKSGTRTFDKLYRGGWDPKVRIPEMDKDGVYAEILYPTAGMGLYWVKDLDYMSACMDAYNLWLAEFIEPEPKRLYGIGQSAAKSPDDLVKDLKKIKALGFKGVMMPTVPGYKDYDDRAWDIAWETACELNLPLCFHILVSQGSIHNDNVRGGKLGNIMNLVRTNQDIVTVFVLGGVFERFPNLKLVCVEADAGWVPHYVQRMDHAMERYAGFLQIKQLSKLPSEYVRDNVFFTFQDDAVAIKSLGMLNPKSLLWASDYPHSDSTWPHSMDVLAKHMEGVDAATVKAIVHDNSARLFDIRL